VTCPISSIVVNKLPDVEWVSLLFFNRKGSGGRRS
jgi:hypothetical protein